jgi:hypothetical protein
MMTVVHAAVARSGLRWRPGALAALAALVLAGGCGGDGKDVRAEAVPVATAAEPRPAGALGDGETVAPHLERASLRVLGMT